MKLNHDCIRSLLLELEERLELHDSLMLQDVLQLEAVNKFTEDDVIYSITKLDEAGYLNANLKFASNNLYFLSVDSISWDGHLFLDTIRDNRVWAKTKSIVSKFSSVSLSLTSKIATDVLSNLIENS